MWVLCLNDMRSPKVENLSPVCGAETAERLLGLLKTESVGSYKDGQWRKEFRQGGLLEWYNPPSHFNHHLHLQNAGSVEDWPEELMEWYRLQVLTLPKV